MANACAPFRYFFLACIEVSNLIKTEFMDNSQPKPAADKKAATKLPSKPISFSGQQQSKKGKAASKINVTGQKKGGSHLLRKLSGM